MFKKKKKAFHINNLKAMVEKSFCWMLIKTDWDIMSCLDTDSH